MKTSTKNPFLLTVAFCLCLLLIGAIEAHAQKKGGYTGPGPAAVSVRDVQDMKDDSKVTLRGQIIRNLGGDKYMFRDGTGEIEIEVDDDKWQGQSVGPEDTIEISGEVDKDLGKMRIDVDRVRKQ